MNILRKYRIPILLVVIAFAALIVFLQVKGNDVQAPTVSSKPKVYKGAEPDTGVKLSEITDGTYYIYHKGKAYPIAANVQTNGTEAATTQTDATRLIMTDSAGTKLIPTLYLGDGDKLIYRNSQTAIDTIRFERYKDEGYSFGIYGITEQPNKTYTMNLAGESNASSDSKSNIRPNSSAQAISTTLTDTKATYTFASVGEGKKAVQVTKDILSPAGFVKSNVLVSNPKAGSIVPYERTYAVNIYSGTENHTFNIKSDTHYFSGMELYAEYTKGLDTTSNYQTLKIPDYLPDGYYAPNFGGLFRLVHGSKYTDEAESFNKRQLEVNQVMDYDTNTEVDADNDQTNCYSTSPDLNSYSTTNPDAFGYNRDAESEDEESGNTTIEAENTDKTYAIKPAKGKTYTFTVTAPDDKGSVSYKTAVEGWSFTMKANDDGTVTYTSSITGNGKENAILVKGFSGDITVDLSGAGIDKTDDTDGTEDTENAEDSEDTSDADEAALSDAAEASDE